MSGQATLSTEAARIADAMPDYEVERELGRGGMGVVFLGRHRRLERSVAIKELPPSFASEPEVRERFSTEARTLATLAHPHIVPIFDYVERDGLCLIVMEQLPGGTVWDRFTTAGLTAPTACAVVMACCAALQHAHGKGVLHLDVKPDNLMFDAESAVKVTDFGIARVISGDRTLGTVDGQVLGTPAYMSPEQARGEDLTPASDVYAAGVMLYELLSGMLPWQGAETASELLTQRLREDPTPLRQVSPHVPEPLADVVMRALSRDAAERYERAEDFGVAIGEACADSWGPEWLDHAGIGIVGSDRLSRAARTTGRTVPLATPPGPSAPDQPAATAATAHAGETIARPSGDGHGAGGTVVTGRAGDAAPGATETGVVGPTPEGRTAAPETVARGVTPAAPGAAPATGAAPPAAPATGSAAPAPAEPGIAMPAEPGVAMPADRGDGAAPPAAPATGPAGGAAPMQFEVVRAAGVQPRIGGADLNRLELADLIGVEDVLDPPRRPWPTILATAGFFTAAVVLALVGLGEPDRTEALEPGQVELAGVDVASGDPVEVDLSEDVPVELLDPALASSVRAVRLEWSYLGIDVTSAEAVVRNGQATVDPGLAQRAVSGRAGATLVLEGEDGVLVEHELPVEATQPWYLTIPGIAGILLVLLALANFETSLKPLRSGHRRLRSVIGAMVWGALLGAAVAALGASVGFAELTIPALVTCAVLGAVGGLSSARARIRIARRRRVRRAVKRAEKSLGVGKTLAGARSG